MTTPTPTSELTASPFDVAGLAQLANAFFASLPGQTPPVAAVPPKTTPPIAAPVQALPPEIAAMPAPAPAPMAAPLMVPCCCGVMLVQAAMPARAAMARIV